MLIGKGLGDVCVKISLYLLYRMEGWECHFYLVLWGFGV